MRHVDDSFFHFKIYPILHHVHEIISQQSDPIPKQSNLR
jgi:hypothetical protein